MADWADVMKNFKFTYNATELNIYDYFYHFNHYVVSKHYQIFGFMYGYRDGEPDYQKQLQGMEYDHLKDKDGWVAGLSAPYTDGGRTVKWITVGTKPSMKLFATITSGSGTITRTDSYLQIGGSYYYASSFIQGVVPKRIIVAVQGGGGGGAGTQWRSSGGGGGSGACVFAVIDVGQYSWTYSVGSGGARGYQYDPQGPDGGNGGDSSITATTTGILAGGGKGADAADDWFDTSPGGAGGSGSVYDIHSSTLLFGAWRLESGVINGRAGGNGSMNPMIGSNFERPQKGGDCSGVIYSTYNTEDREYSANKYSYSYEGGSCTNGAGDSGSGAASAMGNGGDAGTSSNGMNGFNGEIGAGGGGSKYATGWFYAGGYGGSGAIRFFY